MPHGGLVGGRYILVLSFTFEKRFVLVADQTLDGKLSGYAALSSPSCRAILLNPVQQQSFAAYRS